jgi:hypothetical protein
VKLRRTSRYEWLDSWLVCIGWVDLVFVRLTSDFNHLPLWRFKKLPRHTLSRYLKTRTWRLSMLSVSLFSPRISPLLVGCVASGRRCPVDFFGFILCYCICILYITFLSYVACHYINICLILAYYSWWWVWKWVGFWKLIIFAFPVTLCPLAPRNRWLWWIKSCL